MARKGIVLAGGKGTRLGLLTAAVNKQLLPVYDLPMVCYPLYTLKLAGINDVLVISSPEYIESYKNLLGESKGGIHFQYQVQEEPKGLAQAFVLGEEFIGNDDVCLILGDNIFHGASLQETLQEAANNSSPTVFGYQNPPNLKELGVAVFNNNGDLCAIEEKPDDPKSSYAIVGIYFYPNDVVRVAKTIEASARGEYEITAINNHYINSAKSLRLVMLKSDVVWLDTGKPEDLFKAADFIKRARHWGDRIGFLEEDTESPSVNNENQCGCYKNKWAKLLCDERVSVEDIKRATADASKSEKKDFRTPFERDYERVVFSSPFRRLAGKTQVRSFPDVDFVHNRLTHSAEVATVARSLAECVGHYIVERGDIEEQDISKLCWIAQAAGLAHDLGNPPYGHAGEFAVRHWAKLQPRQARIFPNDEVWVDFERFDGNAQAFRLLCSSETRASDFFRFTAASLGAVVKYPAVSTEVEVKKDGSCKFDVFTTERSLYQKVWIKLGLADGERHPISFLSEAADDICYRILDFEDAVLSGVLPLEEVEDIFRAGLGLYGKNEHRDLPIQKLRARLIHQLVEDFVTCFKTHYVDIMDGKVAKDLDLYKLLPDDCRSKMFLKEISSRYNTLYTEREKLVKECGAYTQIPLLLTRFYTMVRDMFSEGDNAKPYDRLVPMSRHLIDLAWNKDFYQEHVGESFSWWMHIVLDYVVGMTDGYINKLAQALH